MTVLDPAKIVLARSEGGVMSLTVDGIESYEYVDAFRAFPLSRGNGWISLREHGGHEIGIIPDPTRLPKPQREILEDELARRYFSPCILTVDSLVEKFGESHWQVVTDSGPRLFRVQSDHTQIREIAGGTLLISDVDGNRYLLKNRKRLPSRILRRIEEQI